MTAQEFRCRVDHHISPVLEGPDEERRAEGVVDDKRNMVSVRHFGHRLNIGHIGVGIAEGLGIDSLRIRSYGRLERHEVVNINDGVGNALCGKRVRNEVE